MTEDLRPPTHRVWTLADHRRHRTSARLMPQVATRTRSQAALMKRLRPTPERMTSMKNVSTDDAWMYGSSQVQGHQLLMRSTQLTKQRWREADGFAEDIEKLDGKPGIQTTIASVPRPPVNQDSKTIPGRTNRRSPN